VSLEVVARADQFQAALEAHPSKYRRRERC
jgi:hypothetical protein